MIALVPLIAKVFGGGAVATAGYFTVKTVAVVTSKVAVGVIGGELLSYSCDRAIERYEKRCTSFYSSVHCILMRSSVVATCGGAALSYAFSVKTICNTLLPDLCNNNNPKK
jgi:hypothetical protein